MPFSKTRLFGLTLFSSFFVSGPVGAAILDMSAVATIRKPVTMTFSKPLSFGSLTQLNIGTLTVGFVDKKLQDRENNRRVRGAPSAGRVNIVSKPNVIVNIASPDPTFKVQRFGENGVLHELTIKDIAFKMGEQTGATLSATVTKTSNALDVGGKLVSSKKNLRGTYTGSLVVNMVHP